MKQQENGLVWNSETGEWAIWLGLPPKLNNKFNEKKLYNKRLLGSTPCYLTQVTNKAGKEMLKLYGEYKGVGMKSFLLAMRADLIKYLKQSM